MTNKKKLLQLLQAMQETSEGCADTYAKLCRCDNVLQIKRDMSNVAPDHIKDALTALRYDAEADALRKVLNLLTDKQYFDVLVGIYLKEEEKK